MDEFIALSTDESFLSNNSSLGGSDQNLHSVFVRFAELEKKITEQNDEIVCLKSTLADVLRRLNQLEGRAIVTTSYHNHNQSLSSQNSNGISKNVPNNRSNSLLKTYGRNLTTLTHHYNGSWNQQFNTGTLSPQSANNRRYQSSTSLQTDQLNGSASCSPSSSPQPSSSSSIVNHYRSTTMHNHLNSIYNNNNTRTPMKMNSSTNLNQMKRWSASQDVRSSTAEMSEPFRNLHALKKISNSSLNIGKQFGPGNKIKNFYYNQVEGVIKFNIFDRTIIINLPTDLLQTYTLNNVTGPPLQRLKLEWVYGYRGKDCRHNLYLLPTGEIVYFLASVVVLYNIDDQIQRHYTGHTSEVRCITIHPNKLLIATGQNNNHDCRFDRRPHIRIWDSVSLNTLHVIGVNGELDRGISCIAFSKFDGGNLLCVVDESNDHVVSLYEWHKGSNGHKLCESKSSCDSVLAVEFHPIEKNSLITIGRGHIHFWDIDGGILTKKVGSFEKQEKPKYILCMSFTDVGELLTGDSNGNIIIWHKNTCRIIRTIQNAHEGPIFDICSLKNGTFVTGGGKDKRIIEWDSNMNRTGKEAKLPEQYGGVRTLTTGKGSMLIVGSTKNCILQGTMALNFSLVIQGHTEDLFGLAIHPTQNQFITAGHDKNIHLWDTMSHLVVWTKDIGESAHAAAFSPDGCVIVISTTTPGRWIVCDATTKQMLSMHNDGSEIIECFKFSSNGRYLGLGSRDNNVYIYQVTEEYRKFNRIGRCMGHSSFITSIDWDTTNSYIQTTSITCEHLYWNATICRQLANVSISRDLEFETHNSTIGFNVFGVWPENFDGPFVNCLDRSHSKKLLVTGDDLGRLNLFSYPASQSKCLHHSFLGHSNQVSSVRFLADDSRIISIGGKDSSILQWSVT